MGTSDTYQYNSVIVAKYIIATANERRVAINITKVQKLLYIAYGFYLAVTGNRLTNEYPHAWPYGPVFPTTRNKLVDVDLYSILFDDPELSSISQDDEMADLMNLVFNAFGGWTASALTAWSHAEGTPWERTTDAEGFKWGDIIPDEYIKSYFSSMIEWNGEK